MRHNPLTSEINAGHPNLGFALYDFGEPSDDSAKLIDRIQQQNHGLELRPEQVGALDAIVTARSEGEDRALIQMATGLGKTTVVAADVYRFLGENPQARVLFLCHQNDILDQAKERFEQLIGKDFSYGKFTGEGKDFHEVTCLFASFQAMSSWREAFLETEFDYVIVDESHHAKATTYEPTLNYLKPQFMLGVTATPDRMDLRDIRQLFGNEVYSLSLEEAIAESLLAPVDYEVITDDVVNLGYLKDSTGRRHSAKQIDREIFAPKRTEEIIRIINEKSVDNPATKRLIFCKGIEQAEEYAQHFASGAALHSLLPKNQQDQLIRQFREGRLDTLATIDMFNEGIDIPDANQLVFLRSTESKTVFLQQLGRGLRRLPGKGSVKVLDFVANCDRLLMLREVWGAVEAHAAKSSTSREPIDKKRAYIGVNGIEFDESSRDILEILAEIEGQRLAYTAWTGNESIELYTRLNTELGHAPTKKELVQLWLAGKTPGWTVLTRDFNNSLTELKRACGIELPDDWLTPHQLANEVGTDPATVFRAIESLGLELPRFQNGPQTAYGISPENAEALRTYPSLQSLSEPPDGYKSRSELLDRYRIGNTGITHVLGKLSIAGAKYRETGSRSMLFFSPEEVSAIDAYMAEEYAKPPLGARTVTEVANEYGVSKATIDNICEKYGIEYSFYLANDGHRRRFILEDDLASIAADPKLQTPPVPDDHVAVKELAKHFTVTHTTIRRYLGDLGITAVDYREGGQVMAFVPSETMEQLERHPAFTIPVAPEGWMSRAPLAKLLHTTESVLNRRITELQISMTTFRKPGKREGKTGFAEYLSPDDIQRLRDLYA